MNTVGASFVFDASFDVVHLSGLSELRVDRAIANGVGSTGMAYRRNRFYDGATGQFNQQDPIGLAGGANAYGFAGGDPVNHSDPFGRSDCDRGHPQECTVGDVFHNFLQGMGDALTPGFREDAGPGWKIGMLVGLLGQASGTRAPGSGQASVPQGGAADADAALGPSARKAVRTLEKRLGEHVQKLEDYKANPDAFDNNGILKMPRRKSGGGSSTVASSILRAKSGTSRIKSTVFATLTWHERNNANPGTTRGDREAV